MQETVSAVLPYLIMAAAIAGIAVEIFIAASGSFLRIIAWIIVIALGLWASQNPPDALPLAGLLFGHAAPSLAHSFLPTSG